MHRSDSLGRWAGYPNFRGGYCQVDRFLVHRTILHCTVSPGWIFAIVAARIASWLRYPAETPSWLMRQQNTPRVRLQELIVRGRCRTRSLS